MNLTDDQHINKFAESLFGSDIAPIIRKDDKTFRNWRTATVCGRDCVTVLLAAATLYHLLIDERERDIIITMAHKQCQVICYS